MRPFDFLTILGCVLHVVIMFPGPIGLALTIAYLEHLADLGVIPRPDYIGAFKYMREVSGK